MKRAIAVLVTALVLAAPVAAQGATRYAAPGGGTTPGCVQALPCSLEYAITGANPEDEVIVTSGTYDVGTTISTETPLFIHGEEGSPPPRILAAPEVIPFKSFAPQHLSYLSCETRNSIQGVLFLPADETVLERLELIARGENALGLRAGNNFTLTDSLIWAGESTGATGLFLQGTASGLPTLRNDTILADGSESVGIGIFVTQENASISMLAVNVIAGAQTDASAAVSPERTKSSAVIHFDHSDLDTSEGNVVSTYGQTAPPQFVAADPPIFLEAPGSPTIDAGANEPSNGAVDLAGNPRSLPEARSCDANQATVTDIGAYEFVPATPTCVPPTAPETKIISFKLRKRQATLRFAASGGSGPVAFECKLDRRSFRPCASPKVYKHLKPRKHVFMVRAVAAGLIDPTPAVRKFKVKGRHHRRHKKGHR
jgi:hypothetical protein